MDVQNSESEEEILVYMEFEDSINIEKYRDIHVLGISEKNPVIQMDDTFFTGKYVTPLGTYMFFEEDPAPKCYDTMFDKLSEKNLKFICKTNKLVTMEHAYVTPKEGTEYGLQGQLQPDDVEPVCFKNLQEALDTFEKWEPLNSLNKELDSIKMEIDDNMK